MSPNIPFHLQQPASDQSDTDMASRARYTNANDLDDEDDEVDVLLPTSTMAPKRVDTVSVTPASAPARRCNIGRIHVILGIVFTLVMAIVMLLWMFRIF